MLVTQLNPFTVAKAHLMTPEDAEHMRNALRGTHDSGYKRKDVLAANSALLTLKSYELTGALSKARLNAPVSSRMLRQLEQASAHVRRMQGGSWFVATWLHTNGIGTRREHMDRIGMAVYMHLWCDHLEKQFNLHKLPWQRSLPKPPPALPLAHRPERKPLFPT